MGFCVRGEGGTPRGGEETRKTEHPHAADCDEQEFTGCLREGVEWGDDYRDAARRPLEDQYRVLVLDGVVLRRKTGAGALARPVLVALGIRADGRKEVIDFRLAPAESAAQWERFLGDLVRRGLTGERLEMLCADGGTGLLAALPTAFAEVPVERSTLM